MSSPCVLSIRVDPLVSTLGTYYYIVIVILDRFLWALRNLF